MGRRAHRLQERRQGSGLPPRRGAPGTHRLHRRRARHGRDPRPHPRGGPHRHAPGLPKGRKGAKFSEVFSKSPNVNWLSAARVFLFGARDVWFVVGIPIYFYAVLSDGTEEGNRAAFFLIGTFMAVWIILYGAVQAAAPGSCVLPPAPSPIWSLLPVAGHGHWPPFPPP